MKHHSSQYHKDAYTLWIDFKRVFDKKTSIDQVLSAKRQKLIDDNGYYVEVIADILCTTARQNIAQRGKHEQNTDGKIREIFKNFFTS